MKLITKIKRLFRIDKYYKPKYKSICNITKIKDENFTDKISFKSDKIKIIGVYNETDNA